MAVRSVLLCFAVIPLLIAGVIGIEEDTNVNAVEEDRDACNSTYGLPLAEFNDNVELANWEEDSDTVESDGASKWDGVWYSTSAAKGGLFLFALYPGSSSPYAGARKVGSWDLSNFRALRIKFLAEGSPLRYRVTFRTNGLNGQSDPLYDLRFTALNSTNWQRVTLPLDEFVPSIQGVINNTLPFDTSKITSVGIVSFGGPGTSSVLVKEIKAV